ncbi:MAG: diguanylate cyclase [Oceanospirillaceae bacterium]
MDSGNVIHQRSDNEFEFEFSILCIDDESSNLKVLNSILSPNYTVFLAKTAQAGLLKAVELQPDLIILDVIMPVMTGFEMIVKLKNNSAIDHIPVIFISGLQSVEDEEKGLLLGGCDYIQKPFHYSIVKARVNTHIKLVHQRKLLERIANIDSLTELFNRRKWDLDSALVWQEALNAQTSCVFGICDIDYFKGYNDTYGHQKGDIALKQISSVLKRCLYQYDGEVYRCGGEEFYFYFPDTKKIAIQAVLSTMTEQVIALNLTNRSSDISNNLSISVGAIKLIPNTKTDLESVLNEADKLLYSVKLEGRNSSKYLAI